MITTIRRLCTILVFFSFFISSKAQELRTFNQNSSRSNHTPALSISLSPVYSSSVNNNKDSLLFRGKGGGFRIGADYFLGNAGIGFSSGFGSSSPDNTAINDFLKNNSIPPDQLLISKSNQQNMYLLLGPSVHFGNAVQLYAHAKGGLFINNGGLISIQQRGAVRAAYRNESTGKSIYPGFQTGLSFQYKGKSDVWSFGIGADYMSTKTEVTNYDARRGGGVEGLKLSQNIKDIVAGISIRYNILSPRDHSSGQSTGRRVLPTVNKREISSPKDAASGLATGKRLLPTVNKKEITSDESGTLNSTESCGPVTKKIINEDGSTEEMTFSCPADALAYERQTPKRDFGDKLIIPDKTNELKRTFAAPHVFEQKGIVSGRLTWTTSNTTGIITNAVITNSSPRGGSVNMNSQTSSTRQTPQSSFGTLVRLSAREAGSGMATGRRQYEPVFIENASDVCNPCMADAKLSSVKNNPLYRDNGMSGANPLYQENKRTAGMDDDCDGIGGIDVYLLDINSEVVVSKTKTEECGDFFFANVPEGNYIVKVSGGFSSKKGYDIYLKSKTDLAGDVSQSSDGMQLLINSSNNNEGAMQKAGISTSRSNIRTKSLSIIEADLDGDGEFESLRATGIFSDGSSRDLTNDVSAKKVNKIDAFTIKQSAMRMNNGANSAATTHLTGITVAKGDVDGDGKTEVINNSHSNIKNLRATATFSDGSTQDVTEALVTNTTHSNVKQYNIVVADLDGDGFAEAVRVTKTRSNIQNNRVAGGDTDGDGIIWSPKSNIKMIRVAAGDLDGDGAADLAAGNLATDFAVLRDRNKTYFETGDKPTQEQRTVGGSLPGGAVISSAMRPGNPIGGLTIKGGKNPGGNLRTAQTNENGEFEFPDLEAGDYTFTVEQRIFIEDETPVTVGDRSGAQDHNSSRLNKTASIIDNDPDNSNATYKKGDMRVTASQNSQSLRMTEPDIEPDAYWIKSNGGGATASVVKAQNNNTVRSNRTDNTFLINNNDNANTNDITIDESGVSNPKEKSGATKTGPVKWTAPESMKTAINNSHSNIKNLLVSLDQLDQQLNSDQNNAKTIVNTSRSNIKNQRIAISNLNQTLDNLQMKDKDAAMDELDQKMAAMNMQFMSLQESLTKLGQQYSSISNVLKTRHDVAMNSIRNMK
jgi:hypothetical protein